MVVGEEFIIGRLGQQPMILADKSISPQHLILRKLTEEIYQIEDLNSVQGTYVFGIRIKRKKIRETTPIQLGLFKTCVRDLLRSQDSLRPLKVVWEEYDKQKQGWNNKQSRVARIPMFVSLGVGAISSPLVTLSSSIGLNTEVTALVPILLMAVAYILSLKYGENVNKKKEEAMSKLNAKFQQDYICPRCHKFLGFISYQVLITNTYCPHCGVPIQD